MKRIRLRSKTASGEDLFNGNEKITSLSVLRLVAGNSPQRPLGIDEMRRRVRVLDALDECKPNSEFVLLEDEDAKALTSAIESFPWSAASKGLLTIIDDVLNAEPAKKFESVEGGKKEG